MKKSISVILLFMFCGLLAIGQNNEEKNGPWKSTYPNGSLKSTGQFRNNLPYGTFTSYYPDGNKKAITVFDNQGIVARNKTWYESGNLMAKGKYMNKQKDSTWLYYGDSTNQLISVENYYQGQLNGESITYYPGTGQPAEVIIFKNGMKQGDLRKYFPDGSIMTEGTYLNDKLNGPFTLYYPEGKIQVKGTYKNGNQLDDWKYFGLDGKEMTYEDFVKSQSNPIDVEDPDKEGKKVQPF
ncbi:MAG: toxin-antitoxin system YwqK family antitoxin [Bacteroidales bacterium]|jgi:antitoxin component YwqK of YwqJK toxin-antitoxin module